MAAALETKLNTTSPLWEDFPAFSQKKRLGHLLKPRTSTSATVRQTAGVRTDVTPDLKEDTTDSNADPLSWWRNRDGNISTAAGNMDSPLRSSLEPHQVNTLAFLVRNKDVIRV